MKSSPSSSVIEDVNDLRSLVISVLPQLLLKLDLIGNKLENSPTTPTNTPSVTRVEISTQTEGEFVGGSPTVADDILEDGVRLEDLLWTEATFPGGIKVESSSDGGAAEGIECRGDENDAEQVMTYSLTQVLEDLEAPLISAKNDDTVLNTPEEECAGRFVEAEEYAIESEVKPDVASTSNMCVKSLVAGSSGNQRPRHERSHTGEKPFKCGYCSKTFPHHSSVVTHERSHTGEKPFKCGYCSKTFANLSRVVTHERIHTKEKPFKCSYCSKSFNQKSNAVEHERTHTGEKPFKCRYCSKSFSRQFDVRRHERTHTKEKPYRCVRCTKAFAVQCNLVKHQRIHHSVQKKR